MKVIKSTSMVLTDETFCLGDFVARVEAEIESDKDWVPLSKTSFIQVSGESFQNLFASVISQESDLTEKKEAIGGLMDDELC